MRFGDLHIVKMVSNGHIFVIVDWKHDGTLRSYVYTLVPLKLEDRICMNGNGEYYVDLLPGDYEIRERTSGTLPEALLDFVEWQDIEDIRGSRLGVGLGIV